jgi:hypothetical protein
VPPDSGVYAGLAGAFLIATFDDRDVVYVDGALRGEVVERSDDVAIMRRMWELLRAESLPMSKSMALIAKVAETWA